MPNKNKMKCPKCGNHEKKLFNLEHENDFRDDLLMCQKCGHQGKKIVFIASKNPFIKESEGNFSDQKDKMPSNENNAEHTPAIKTRKKDKGYRKKPEERLIKDPENVRRLSMSNPFVKESKSKESVTNPFVKEAREFKLTDTQKKQDEDKNMLFPEGKQGEDGEKKDVSKGDNSSELTNYRRFDTVDRKERRHSDDPSDFVPGHKEWVDREVDKYYDGWEKDHIENAGGKVVGSNTEKVMNLDDGERIHKPEFPVEAAYEALLEGRHELDGDLVKVVAEGRQYTFKKADVEKILKKKIAQYPDVGDDQDIPGNDIEIDVNLARVMRDTVIHNEFVQSYVKGLLDKLLRGTPSPVPVEVAQELVNSLKYSDSGVTSAEGEIINILQEKIDRSISNERMVNKINRLDINEPQECGGSSFASTNPFVKKQVISPDKNPFVIESRKLTKEEKVEDEQESVDKMKTTEGRFDSEEVNGGERVHRAYDAANTEKRKDVHSKKKSKSKDKKGKSEWWMTGPNSGLGEGGDGGDGGAAAENTNPFTKEAKEDTSEKVRFPYCPSKKEHKDEKIRLVNGGDNDLLKCPKCKQIFDINGNKKGELQPLWESDEIK